jgi:hypothetical protein
MYNADLSPPFHHLISFSPSQIYQLSILGVHLSCWGFQYFNFTQNSMAELRSQWPVAWRRLGCISHKEDEKTPQATEAAIEQPRSGVASKFGVSPFESR